VLKKALIENVLICWRFQVVYAFDRRLYSLRQHYWRSEYPKREPGHNRLRQLSLGF
jgi:hypothetical protein